MTKEQLRQAICEAQSAAMAHKDHPDGGTCNFDTPVITLPEGIKPKDAQDIKDADGRPMLEKCGSRFWKGWWYVNVPLYGQADRRTKMAEAASESLEKAGINASVYYQMD